MLSFYLCSCTFSLYSLALHLLSLISIPSSGSILQQYTYLLFPLHALTCSFSCLRTLPLACTLSFLMPLSSSSFQLGCRQQEDNQKIVVTLVYLICSLSLAYVSHRQYASFPALTVVSVKLWMINFAM